MTGTGRRDDGGRGVWDGGGRDCWGVFGVVVLEALDSCESENDENVHRT